MIKKLQLLLIAVIIIFSSISFSACSCSMKDSELAMLRYYAANIGNFDSLALAPSSSSQTINANQNINNSSSSSDKMRLLVKHKKGDSYKDAHFVIHDDKKGELEDFNGNKVKVGDIFTQDELPFYIDKLCVMYDYTFISFVNDVSEYKRPNKELVEWDTDPAHPTRKEGNEYDFEGYCSNKTRASFVIDNRNGKLYYISTGVTIDIEDLGFIEGQLLCFGSDYKVTAIEPKYKVNNYKMVVRDSKGNNFVPSDTNYYDYENGVVYYKFNGEDAKDSYIRTNVGDVVHIKFSSNQKFGMWGQSATIESIKMVNEDLSETELDENFVATCDVDYYHKMHVGGDFVNRIENGYVYVSSGYGKLMFKRFAFVEGNTNMSVYYDCDYFAEENETYKYLSIWDHDTVIIETNLVDGTQGYYYSNVFDDNEYKGTDDTISNLHLIMSNCTSENLTNFGLAYLAEKTREMGVLIKDNVRYSLVEDVETKSIRAVAQS